MSRQKTAELRVLWLMGILCPLEDEEREGKGDGEVTGEVERNEGGCS